MVLRFSPNEDQKTVADETGDRVYGRTAGLSGIRAGQGGFVTLSKDRSMVPHVLLLCLERAWTDEVFLMYSSENRYSSSLAQAPREVLTEINPLRLESGGSCQNLGGLPREPYGGTTFTHCPAEVKSGIPGYRSFTLHRSRLRRSQWSLGEQEHRLHAGLPDDLSEVRRNTKFSSFSIPTNGRRRATRHIRGFQYVMVPRRASMNNVDCPGLNLAIARLNPHSLWSFVYDVPRLQEHPEQLVTLWAERETCNSCVEATWNSSETREMASAGVEHRSQIEHSMPRS
nr:hypothetical protein CFP56_56946 [Quercus suber]